jgi:hypothetical protein
MATTTNYGFEVPDDTDLVKDGAAAMRELGQDVDTQLFTALGGDYPGLRLVKKQTIGTGVGSVVVSSAFSATYQNYKIIVTGGVGSTANEFRLNLTGNTAGYYGGPIFKPFNSTTPSGVVGNNFGYWVSGFATTSGMSHSCELLNPFLTQTTSFSSTSAVNNAAGSVWFNNGFHDSTTSFTGFTLTMSSGTITGGTIYVYGYGIS